MKYIAFFYTFKIEYNNFQKMKHLLKTSNIHIFSTKKKPVWDKIWISSALVTFKQVHFLAVHKKESNTALSPLSFLGKISPPSPQTTYSSAIGDTISKSYNKTFE